MKSKQHFSAKATKNAPSPIAPALGRPTHGQISALARSIWERRGRPEGQDAAIWLEAESKLLAGAISSGADGEAVADTQVLLGESTGTIEDRLQAFGNSAGSRSATSL